MGLHTTYVGRVVIEPALSRAEVDLLRGLNSTRHWDRPGDGLHLSEHPAQDELGGDTARYNTVALGMPGLWCPWTVDETGESLHWDGIEKPYGGEQWLRWLVAVLLAPSGRRGGRGLALEHGLTFDHVLEGVLVGERRETLELFALEVRRNRVRRRVLVPGLQGASEWGLRSEEVERDERSQRLRDRRERYARARAEDRRRDSLALLASPGRTPP